MNKWSQIVNEITGWIFIAVAFLFAIDVLQKLSEAPAIVVGYEASIGVLFAILGFGFLFLRRIEDMKKLAIRGNEIDDNDYKPNVFYKENNTENKNKQNWIIVGIVIGIVAIGIALIPVIFKIQ